MLVVGILYCRNPETYFCAYDDFVEVHRAAFEDSEDPVRVFTTTHFESYKYRPLNRGINLLTYSIGKGRASFFRTRNALFHLLNVVLVYLLGWLLFARINVSAAAAVLFGLHPQANQAVVGAVMTNTAAHALFLVSLICFVISLKKNRGSLLWLGLALICGWLGIFLYEAGIVIFPLMAAFLLVSFIRTRKKIVDRRYIIALAIGTVVLLAVYFGIRAKYVPYSSRDAVPKVTVMVKNVAMYAGAMVLPIDSVLANQWFGTPLPSEIKITTAKLLAVVISALLILIGVSLFLILTPRGRKLLAAIEPNHILLALAILSSLSILVLFTEKASETYMYLPMAFAALLFCSLLDAGLSGRKTGPLIYVTIICGLIVLYGSATWVRNGLVARCGATANQIVSELKQDRLKQGVWFLWFAPVPGEPASRRYGMYGWRGIDTVGESAVQSAAQLASGNKSVAATLVSPEALKRNCDGARSICFLVHENGTIAHVGSNR